VRHTLDALGRATRSDIRYGTTDGQGAFDFAIGQGFDHDGQIASHTYPDGSQQSYGYASWQRRQMLQVLGPAGQAPERVPEAAQPAHCEQAGQGRACVRRHRLWAAHTMRCLHIDVPTPLLECEQPTPTIGFAL